MLYLCSVLICLVTWGWAQVSRLQRSRHGPSDSTKSGVTCLQRKAGEAGSRSGLPVLTHSLPDGPAQGQFQPPTISETD